MYGFGDWKRKENGGEKKKHVCVSPWQNHRNTCVCHLDTVCQCSAAFLDGYCSTVQGLLDWFEGDVGFTELLFIQIGLCVM